MGKTVSLVDLQGLKVFQEDNKEPLDHKVDIPVVHHDLQVIQQENNRDLKVVFQADLKEPPVLQVTQGGNRDLLDLKEGTQAVQDLQEDNRDHLDPQAVTLALNQDLQVTQGGNKNPLGRKGDTPAHKERPVIHLERLKEATLVGLRVLQDLKGVIQVRKSLRSPLENTYHQITGNKSVPPKYLPIMIFFLYIQSDKLIIKIIHGNFI